MKYLFDNFIVNLKNDRKELIEIIEPISDSKMKKKKSQDEWSISEVLHHIYLSEMLINNLLDKLISKNILKEEINYLTSESFTAKNKSLQEITEESILSLAAVKGTEPESDKSKKELLSLLESSRNRTAIHFEFGKYNNLANFVFKHRRIGDLNFYEWILFVLKHEKAHIGQIKKILKN